MYVKTHVKISDCLIVTAYSPQGMQAVQADYVYSDLQGNEPSSCTCKNKLCVGNAQKEAQCAGTLRNVRNVKLELKGYFLSSHARCQVRVCIKSCIQPVANQPGVLNLHPIQGPWPVAPAGIAS